LDIEVEVSTIRIRLFAVVALLGATSGAGQEVAAEAAKTGSVAGNEIDRRDPDALKAFEKYGEAMKWGEGSERP
jgi:hypothetical protein